ncbi:MAG: LytTR family DNA-binding domain-containing protein [Ferruginibacter sp.]
MQQLSTVYSAIIVDDNDIDRLTTQVYVKRHPFLNIAGIYSSAEQALEAMEKTNIDVLFLDIDMPGLSGLEMRRKLGNDFACIFITSYPDYAVESFELAALDFLVNPLQKERFEAAMLRLEAYLELKNKASLFEASIGGDSIFIKEGHEQVKIKLHDIIYLEALKEYTRIVTADKKFCVLTMLGNLLQETNFKSFTRIHRSYAVQNHFVNKITAKEILVNDFPLPIGRSYKDSLEKLFS